MKYLGAISDPYDLVNKEYVDNVASMYSVTTSSTNSSIDARGLYGSSFMIYMKNASDVTMEKALQIKLYLQASGSSSGYLLEIVSVYLAPSNLSITVTVKSHYGNPQSTTASYLSAGYVTAIAPFEMTSIVVTM